MGRGYREAGRARSKKTPAAIICERHRSDSSATYVHREREIRKRERAFREIAGEFHDDNQMARRRGGDAGDIRGIGSDGKREPTSRDVVKSRARAR